MSLVIEASHDGMFNKFTLSSASSILILSISSPSLKVTSELSESDKSSGSLPNLDVSASFEGYFLIPAGDLTLFSYVKDSSWLIFAALLLRFIRKPDFFLPIR